MECSTPVSEMREPPKLLGEDSPIMGDSSSASCTSNESTDTISQVKRKAGISNELDGMNVTPTKELSPDSMDRRLALHTIDIVKAAVNNPLVEELREYETHTISLAENSFTSRKPVDLGAAAGMVVLQPADVNVTQSVGMNGMNKTPEGGVHELQSVGMNGMNKTPERGVGGKPSNVLERSKKRVTRRVNELNKGMVNIKVQLGKNAPKELMESIACPDAPSPKRPTPMEIDQHPPTPALKRKKGKHHKNKIAPDQRLITEVWNKGEGSIEYEKDEKVDNGSSLSK